MNKKKGIAAVLGLTLALAASSSHALIITDPSPVSPGDTTVATIDVDLGGSSFFDLFLVMPADIRLLSIADNPSDNSPGESAVTGYQRWITGYFESSTSATPNEAVFNSLVGTFFDGSTFVNFDEDPYNATDGTYGVRVTDFSGGTREFSKVDVTLQALTNATLGDHSLNVTYCTKYAASGGLCENGGGGELTVSVQAAGSPTPSIPEPPLALALLGGLLMLVGWRRRA